MLPPKVFYVKNVLKILKNFTGKQTTLLEPRFNIEEEALAYVFSCKFYEIFKDTFFTEHFRMTASV